MRIWSNVVGEHMLECLLYASSTLKLTELVGLTKIWNFIDSCEFNYIVLRFTNESVSVNPF